MNNSIPCIFYFLLLGNTLFAFTQNADSTKGITNFSGNISVTNNGISFIPSFSLEKPALIFDLSAGRRLAFEPQLRFALEGKPWSFIFWWRYRIVPDKRFRITIGAHPALSFKTLTITTNNVTKEAIVSSRYLAGEVAPNYRITDNINIGVYYLYAYCLETAVIKHTHFLTLNSNISGIRLMRFVSMRIAPQVYYLKMGRNDGYYFSSSIAFTIKDIPLSASLLFNKNIKTTVPGSKDFIWNASLVYSFRNSYRRL